MECVVLLAYIYGTLCFVYAVRSNYLKARLGQRSSLRVVGHCSGNKLVEYVN